MKKSYNKILLVNPGHNPAFAFCEPLNLALLASYLMAHGIAVRIADELVGDDVGQVMDEFLPDLVGITACTPLAYDAYRIAKIARVRKIPTVMGGVHASVMPEEALEHVDMVVKGEGELALLDIIKQGITSGIHESKDVLDLNSCPPPARDLLHMDFYLGIRQRYPQTGNYYFVPLKEPVLNIMVGRGCYWNCTFCHNTWRDKPCRFRNPESVINEMTQLKQNYGIKYLCFMDDNLFGYRSFCKELFPELVRRKTGLLWGANARVDCVNEDMLSLAKEAGCRRINFGFESGSQKVLDTLNKNCKVEQIEKAVALCRQQGIQVVGTFMIGSPGETTNDIEATRRLIRRLPLEHVGISITTPLPGTALWQSCAGQGRIPPNPDWTLFDFDHVPIQVSEIFTAKELVALQRRLFFNAYIHSPRIIWNVTKAFIMRPAAVLRRVKSVVFAR